MTTKRIYTALIKILRVVLIAVVVLAIVTAFKSI